MSTVFSIERFSVLTLVNADTYSADITPVGQDTGLLEGNALVHVNIGVATQGSFAITVQHNSVATSDDAGWANVPVALLTDKDTGKPAQFTTVTTASGTFSNQVKVLNLQGCKRYVRVFVDVTASGAGEVCAQLFARDKY